MGRLDLMIEHESGYKPKQASFKRIGMIDSTIEKEKQRKRYEPPKKEEKRSPNLMKEEKRRSPSPTPSTSHHEPKDEADGETEMYKDYDLYLAAKNGDLHHFQTILDRVSTTDSVSSADILSRLSPIGNTFLHVAATHGNTDIVNFIATIKPSFVLAKNFSGETALHLVAKSGDESMVKSLVQIHRDLLLVQNAAGDEDNLLMAKNERGNTALHEALFNRRTSIAEYLIREAPELSYQHNNNMTSPLYVAADLALVDCVSLILRLCTDDARLDELFQKKSPIEVAIMRKHRDVLDAIFNTNPRLIQVRDGEGRNLLHFAAFVGHLEEARYLLNKYALNATQKDKHGILPIHLASSEGHVDIIALLLQDLPDPSELLDRSGGNILHVAAKRGRSNVLSFVVKNPHLHHLLNMKDKSGNTPLHWASYHFHPKIVNTLTWNNKVDVKAANNNGMSALDVAEHYMSHNPQFRQRLTWAALKAAGVPRYFWKSEGSSKSKRSRMIGDDYKERVNTLLLVATLVATVTFAAGFTMPGGYISSDSGNTSEMGMATMWREKGFHVFVLCDALAMYCSIVVATTLIWAQLGDLKFALVALTVAVPLLGGIHSWGSNSC